MKYFLLIVAMGCMLHLDTVAREKHGHQKPDPAKMAEMRTWFETEVYPQLKKMHDQYDASLSAEDLTTLNTLRDKAAQLKREVRADVRALKGQGLDKQEMSERLHDLREQKHDAMDEIIESVRPIIERSKETLKSIFETNKATIEAWRDEAEERFDGMPRSMMPFSGGRKKAALRFVLWDGNMPEPPSKAGKVNNRSGETASPFGGTSNALTIAPNPSGTTAKVTISGVPNGQVHVDVLDMNGTTVASHVVTSQDGTVDATIPTSSLPDGTYMVTVKTPTGRRSAPLVVSR